MKLIGHVASAVLVASPLIHYRHYLPAVAHEALSDYQMLWWVGVWSAVPDLDILLSRWTPMKHRGFTSHSLYTAIFCGLLVVLGWAVQGFWLEAPVEGGADALGAIGPFLVWQTAFLTFLAVLVHLLGDALTKTGVPLLQPNRMWHVPLIGGHATFDNYALNMIPVAAAGFVLSTWFGLSARTLWSFMRWHIPQ